MSIKNIIKEAIEEVRFDWVCKKSNRERKKKLDKYCNKGFHKIAMACFSHTKYDKGKPEVLNYTYFYCEICDKRWFPTKPDGINYQKSQTLMTPIWIDPKIIDMTRKATPLVDKRKKSKRKNV